MEQIHPDFFYGINDKYLDGAPVFKPSMAQFLNFDLYMQSIDTQFGTDFGLIKIIPPPEWINSLPNIKPQLKSAKVSKPIAQHFNGTLGVYRQAHTEIKRHYSVQDFVKHSLYEHHRPPYLKLEHPLVKKRMNGASFKKVEHRTTRASSRSSGYLAPSCIGSPNTSLPTHPHSLPTPPRCLITKPPTIHVPNLMKGPLERPSTCFFTSLPSHAPLKSYSSNPTFNTDAINTSTDMLSTVDVPSTNDNSIAAALLPTLGHVNTAPNNATSNSDTEGHDRILKKPRLRSAIGRRYKFHEIDLDKEYTMFEGFEDDLLTVRLSAKYVRETLEREYWRSIGVESESVPMYGSDLQGTLWPSENNPQVWNTNKFDTILGKCMPARIPGVNVPYLYFGTWRATFGWHAEDADLYSINYLHFGAPKLWYAIPSSQASKFEALAIKLYPLDYKACSQFLRHKTFQFSPSVLEAEGITVHRMVQEKNEFVITFPRGYHAGFNLGFNCAESVNFALPRWFEFGKSAQTCMCVDHSVSVDACFLESVYLESIRLDISPEKVVHQRIKQERAREFHQGRSSISPGVGAVTTIRVKPVQGTAVADVRLDVGSYLNQRCEACPIITPHNAILGPLLPTMPFDHGGKSRYVHLACAQYIPELGLSTNSDIVHSINHVHSYRFVHRCAMCGRSGDAGLAVQCSVVGCSTYLHPGCAIVNGLASFGIGAGVRCGMHLLNQRTMQSALPRSSTSMQPPPYIPTYPYVPAPMQGQQAPFYPLPYRYAPVPEMQELYWLQVMNQKEDGGMLDENQIIDQVVRQPSEPGNLTPNVSSLVQHAETSDVYAQSSSNSNHGGDK